MAAWPLAAGAQEPALPLIGVVLGLSDSNPEHRSFFEAFIDELTRLGWKDGRTVRIASAGLTPTTSAPAFSPPS
jgi:hypothetical protein